MTAKTDDFNISVRIEFCSCCAFDTYYLESIYSLLNLMKENKELELNYQYTFPIIMLSVSFLEATINHLFYIFQNNIKDCRDLKSLNYNLLNNMYKDFKIDKFAILDKFCFVLKYGRNIDIKGKHVFELTSKIIKLRNILVHNKPYVVTSSIIEKEDDEIVNILKGEYKISDIPTSVSGRWKKYLGYEGASWIANTVLEFHTDFFELLLPNTTTIFYEQISKIINNHPKPPKPKKYKHKVIKEHM